MEGVNTCQPLQTRLRRMFCLLYCHQLVLSVFLLLTVEANIDKVCPSQCICVPKGMSCEKPGLRQLPPPHSTQLEYILIENQTFDSIHLGQTELSMYTSKEFGGSVQMKNLYIRGCNIESIGRYAFQTLGSQLEMIDLTGNPLKHIGDYAFAGLNQLTLVLDEIEQPEFSSHAFVGLTRMKSLVMQNAKLTTLPFESLQQLTAEGRLEKLMLRGNRLHTLESKYDQIFQRLQSFDIRDNPWHCDCQLNWLIQRYRTLVVDQRSPSGNRNQPTNGRALISTAWELEDQQPRCASPVSFMGRNFTNLITNIDQIYGRPSRDLGSVTKLPSVLYCRPPRLSQLTVDLSNVLMSEDAANRAHSPQSTNTPDAAGEWTPNAKLKCVVQGSRQLVLKWLYHDINSGVRLVGNHSVPETPPSGQIPPSDKWTFTTNDQFTGENDLKIFKSSQEVDIYSCLAQDVIGNISASVRIKWPSATADGSAGPVPVVSTKSGANVSKHSQKHWRPDESGLSSGISVLHTPQFSLSDMLWAVMGTFFSTLLLFFVIYKALHSPLYGCTNQKCYKLKTKTSDSLTIGPGDSSLVNSSPLNAKQQTNLSDLLSGNSVASTQYGSHPGVLPITNGLLQGHTYHLVNGAPMFNPQTTLPVRLPNRSMPHEVVSSSDLIVSQIRPSVISTDGSVNSVAAYEPVVYADANCTNLNHNSHNLVSYDIPGYAGGPIAVPSLGRMRLYNEQQIPLLLNNYLVDMNRSAAGRPTEFISSVMRIPPPPATPQPSLPESANSLHIASGFEPEGRSYSPQTASTTAGQPTNLLLMQAGYPSSRHNSSLSETLSG